MKQSQPITALAAAAFFLITMTDSGRGETFGDVAAALGQPIMGQVSWLANGPDVNGEVGHAFSLPGPGFSCPGGWSFTMEKISGELPPGLTEQNNGTISGVPAQRGHWIVTLRLSNIRCGGFHYTFTGLTQAVAQKIGFHDLDKCSSDTSPPAPWTGGNCQEKTIRFHITGSGIVHD